MAKLIKNPFFIVSVPDFQSTNKNEFKGGKKKYEFKTSYYEIKWSWL